MPQEPAPQATRGRFYKFQGGEDADAKVAQPFFQTWLRAVVAQPREQTPNLRAGTQVCEAWL